MNRSSDQSLLRYQLDISGLVNRARRLESLRSGPRLPDLAALCLRIAHHSRCLACARAPLDELREWATGRYSDWIKALVKFDFAVVAKTLESDPVNLLLGGLCLPEEGDREHVISAFNTFSEELDSQGLSVTSAANSPVVAALLRALGKDRNVGSSQIPIEPLSSAVGLDRLAGYALTTTEFGTRQPAVLAGSWIESVLEAYLLKSARTHDLNDAGLALLASALLGIAPERRNELFEWLVGVCRSDGLFGFWDFYEDAGTTAHLLASANVYWGLHAACKIGTPLYPKLGSAHHMRGISADMAVDRSSFAPLDAIRIEQGVTLPP